MTYRPAQYGLLVAPISPLAAKALTSWLSRETVMLRSAQQPAEVREEVRTAYQAMETMARVFDAIRAERTGCDELQTEPNVEAHKPQPTPLSPAAAPSESISAADAAKILGVGERRVRQLLDADKIQGRRVAGRWLVNAASVEDYVLAKDVAA
jgi:hypothetical protein